MPTPTDVVVTWDSRLTDADTARIFGRPTRVLSLPRPDNRAYPAQVQAFGWPHPVRGILAHFGVAAPLRLALIGFSEGCQGVREVLKSADAGYVETAIMIDGVHGMWSGDGPNRDQSNIIPESIGAVVGYAGASARGPLAIGAGPPGQHNCVITHSSVVPPGYPSTTQTARVILDAVFGLPWPIEASGQIPDAVLNVSHSPPLELKGNENNQHTHTSYERSPVSYHAGRSGFHVIGYADLDPSGVNDHIYQANVVMPLVTEHLLAKRWTDVDPSAAVCAGGVTGVSGAACNPTAPVRLPADYQDNPQDATIEWKQYFSAGQLALKPGQGRPSGWSTATSLLLGGALGAAGALAGKLALDHYRRTSHR